MPQLLLSQEHLSNVRENESDGAGDLCAANAAADDDDDDNDDARARSRDAPGTAAIAPYNKFPGILDQISAMAVLTIVRNRGSHWHSFLDTEASAVLR